MRMAKPIWTRRCLTGMSTALSLLTLLCLSGGITAYAFAEPFVRGCGSITHHRCHRRSLDTKLRVLSSKDPDDWSYGERSRPFRRDVFGYDDWVNHRSTDRFAGNLLDILKSGVFRELVPPCLFTSSAAVVFCLYNVLLVAGYQDLSGLHHEPIIANLRLPLLKLPADVFSLVTPSLALLLGKSRVVLASTICSLL